jgi:hypothetical protein
LRFCVATDPKRRGRRLALLASKKAKIRFVTALLIAKALLLGFLIVACGALTVTYVRRRRAGVQPWETLCLTISRHILRRIASDSAAAVNGLRAVC